MNVLIVTEPDDIHAMLVKLALEKKDVQCDLLFSADMPSKQKNSIFISNHDFLWSTIDDDSLYRYRYDCDYDSIWWRRPRRPHLPETLHQDDITFAKKENYIYHDSIPYLLSDSSWWVNPVSSQNKTRSKIIQLKLAQQCGFKLPETLISNSPENIKSFLLSNNKSQVIYKPFLPQYWVEENKIKILYTEKITMKDLPSDAALQLVPGIYQQYIAKKYELRVTCFGSYISAVKIDSQKHVNGQTDWRRIQSKELSLSPIELPQTIKNKISLFMKKIGVVFGCFDFIVTPEDEIIFLELNEQGQFLWVEEIRPELSYLDLFCEFIINKHFNFIWKKSNKTIYTADLDSTAQKLVAVNIDKHIYLNQIKRVA